MPLGILAAQITHAAGESSPGNLPSGTYAVVLAVDDEESLKKLADQLTKKHVRHIVIIESDAPFANEAMAIGVAFGRNT